ncbi:Signal recognition particle subunit SRP68 [Morella rubra]|uniref:Signal recognition particle subunit SRP68 n=1 Tax=Morella rubra TaxID=262757 RepID=A0A6A1VX26_9ROSI|nr:Signal recognition particle subunit SRP68 [Morella rubra]
MGKQNEASVMEIDDAKTNLTDQISPKFSINVLQLLKSAQLQHGLRHGDYTRYRRYCTARLRRLYKSLKFTHGRGKYTRKSITESTVTEVRFLHLILYTAERAWSHAMEKRQLPDGPNARQRIYLIGRLRKAVKWATLFSQLCAIKGDSRTSLEAEAYASYMKGNLLFEQDQNWDTALMNFKSARAVYEELGKYGDLENQVLCRERVEELEPSIRYCLHKIGESNIQASELLQIGEMEGPALDLFKAKLEAVMSEARSQQAASMTEFHWLGHRFPISNAKTRVAILKAQELEKDLQGVAADSLPAEKRLAIFDKIFTAYHEARSCIRSDLASAGNAENVKDDLNGLDKAVSAVLGQRTIERNQLLVSIAKSKLTRRRDEKNERVTKPEELVRLYDLLLQNTADLSDLVSSGRDRKPEEMAFSDECALKSLFFRAERFAFFELVILVILGQILFSSISIPATLKGYQDLLRTYFFVDVVLNLCFNWLIFSLCFYLAKSYSLAGKRAEAYGLYCRARSLAEDTLQKFQLLNESGQIIKELKMLCDECRSNSCIEHAKGIMEEVKAPENLSKKISNMSLTGADNKLEKYLLEKLDRYESAVGDSTVKGVSRIEVFPPAFQAIPRNPIVLDLAYNFIDFPSLENRMKKDKKGFISRLWR